MGCGTTAPGVLRRRQAAAKSLPRAARRGVPHDAVAGRGRREPRGPRRVPTAEHRRRRAV